MSGITSRQFGINMWLWTNNIDKSYLHFDTFLNTRFLFSNFALPPFTYIIHSNNPISAVLTSIFWVCMVRSWFFRSIRAYQTLQMTEQPKGHMVRWNQNLQSRLNFGALQRYLNEVLVYLEGGSKGLGWIRLLFLNLWYYVEAPAFPPPPVTFLRIPLPNKIITMVTSVTF